jgi:transcriptional regulator with XRE-family HTH domain
MGSQKWTDDFLGVRVKTERERRGWSQAQMAKMLCANGIQVMHPTTIAKIEAGDRSLRINEAAAIADLFAITVDALLGREGPDDSTLTFALMTLRQYADYAVELVEQTQMTAADIQDQLESIEQGFKPTGMRPLHDAARTLTTHVEAARLTADKIASAIAEMQRQPGLRGRRRK